MLEVGSSLKVLVIDDDKASRMIQTFYLRKITPHVDIAGSGSEGVSACQQKRYDIILMDIEMPGMNGYETTQKIRQWEMAEGLAPVPIIAVSGHNRHDVEQEFAAAGLSGYLRKPFSPDDLADVIFNLKSRAASGGDALLPPESRNPQQEQAALLAGSFPGINVAQGLRYAHGSLNTYLSVLKMFSTAHADASAGLQAAMQHHDRTAVRQIAHKIKSIAGYIGAVSLEQSAAALERAAAGQSEPVGPHIPVFRQLMDEASQGIDQIIKQQASLALTRGRDAAAVADIDNNAIQPLIAELMRHIEHNSIQAEALALELQTRCALKPVQEKLPFLIEQLKHYNYKGAKAALADIQASCRTAVAV